MKFQIEFSNTNLLKFRLFIKMCCKTFSKSGIIMTITDGEHIRVVADPFNISDQFNRDYCITKTIEIYKNYIFIEYPLIPMHNNSAKNSTFNTLVIRISKEEDLDKILTFRLDHEQLEKLNDLLQTNFLASDQITIKACPTPDFIKKKVKNCSKCYLTIFDNSKNSTKSGILFKSLKKPYIINDYEDEMENGENKLLGKYLFSSIIRTKIIKRFALLASKNSNKNMNLYLYKENDLKEGNVKSFLYFSYFSNSYYLGRYVHNDEKNDEDQFKNIHKIPISSDILLKILKNFNDDINNPDFISVWTKGFVFKTNFTLKYEGENNEQNNFEENENLILNEIENDEENRIYMLIKAFKIFEKEAEILKFENLNGEDGLEKRKYILNMIENNVDEKHDDELNKSLDLSDIEDGDIFRGNNSLMNEDDEEEEIEEEIEVKNKKRKNKNKKKDESEDNYSNDEDKNKKSRKKSNKNNQIKETKKKTGKKRK